MSKCICLNCSKEEESRDLYTVYLPSGALKLCNYCYLPDIFWFDDFTPVNHYDDINDFYN